MFKNSTAICYSKDNELENIEFMSYSWNVKMPINRNKIMFYPNCNMYSLLNKNGINKTYSCVYKPNKFEEYFESTVDKKIIDSILHSFDNLKIKSQSEIKYDSNIGCIKALPILRIRLNYKNKKTESYYYNFVDDGKEYSSIIKLHSALQINRIGENYKKIVKDSDLENKRDEFLKYSMKEDTTLFPKPKKIDFVPQG
jgi:hypothetical protein